jgi:hypothetical protein
MEERVPQLSASSLFEARVKKDKARLRAYNDILSAILHKIAFTAAQPNQPTAVYYNVPPFVLGLPSMDLEDCIVYLVFQLRTQGYEVRYTYPNLLWVSWAHHETKYFREQNPVVQAMIPPKMAGPEKRRGASQVNMRTAMSGQQGAGPALRAADYTPPAGFVETMERPSPYKKSVTFAPGLPGGQTGGQTGDVLADLWKIN